MAPSTLDLRDGRRLRIRPIEPDDKEALSEGFRRLSPESRYRRFFAPLSQLSPTDLRYLTEVDHRNHEAVIGFDAGTGEAVGVARYVRSDDPGVAEVAVTVADDWHHVGVATGLLEALVRRARAEGVDRFVALVLEENDAAVELFQQFAENDSEPRRSASGHLELVIELPDPEQEVRSTLLGRALAAAAHGVPMNPWRLLKRRVHETAEHAVEDPDAPEPADGRDGDNLASR